MSRLQWSAKLIQKNAYKLAVLGFKKNLKGNAWNEQLP